MTTGPDVLIDKIFFGIGTVVALFVAWRPAAFFRTLALGRLREGEIPAGLLRAVQVIAAVVAISSIIYLAGGAAWLGRR